MAEVVVAASGKLSTMEEALPRKGLCCQEMLPFSGNSQRGG